MSIQKLIQLSKTRELGPNIMEKADLVDYLISSDDVELIPAPLPAKFSLSELNAMPSSEIVSYMQDAAVFFHPQEVQEKTELIRIFNASGQLELIPEESESTYTVNSMPAVLANTD